MIDPIRIFVGTEPKMELPTLVLEHSVRIRSSLPVEFDHMQGGVWDLAPGGRTGFSFRRWLIPEACGYSGRAIYMDSDQVCLADIADLWRAREVISAPTANTSVWCAWKGRRPLVSVMVIDCERGREWRQVLDRMEAGEISKQQVMHGRWLVTPAKVDPGWNHIDRYVDGQTKILHYSDLSTQPWFYPDHPHSGIWLEALKDAMHAGVVTEQDLQRASLIYGKRSGLHPENLRRVLA